MKRDPAESALGSYLRWRLEVLGMTPTDLSDRSGVARSTVYRLLGDKPPEMVSTPQLRKLAATLEIEPLALAELWHGLRDQAPLSSSEDKETIVRGFILATEELTPDELRAALEVARAAAGMVTPKGKRRPKGR